MNARRAAWAAPCLWLLAAVALAQEGHPAAGAPGPRGAPDVPAGPAAVIVRLVHETRPEAVANADVLLYAMSADGSAGLRQGRTDANGRFRFEGVSNAPDVTYLVGARSGEIPFGKRFAFAAGEREHRVELALSDPIADTSRAAAAGVEIRVERGCTHLRVNQKHQIEARGDRVVFVPATERAGAAPIFEVELPAEAAGFEAITGGDGLVQDGRRVRFFGPLYPGEEQTIEFGYGLPLAAASFAIGFPSGSPALAVLAPKGVLDVSSDALRAAPERAIDGQSHAALRGAPIAAGGSLALAVAPIASAPSPVRTARAQLWLELDDAALEVEEQIEIVVESGAPLASAAAPLLCIPLPAETAELRFSTQTFGAGLRRDPSGALAIHGPLPQGTSQLALSYRLPATGKGATLTKSFDRALPLLSVLVADNGVIAETARLHRRKSTRVGDRNYLHLEAFAVVPGESISLGLARTSPASASGRAAPIGFALLAGIAALGFLLGPLRGPLRASGAQAVGREHPDGEAASIERDAIVRSLEALDEDLETGKLSAEDHAAMRASLRARAAGLLQTPQRAAAEPQPAPRFCSGCGAALRPTDRFCSQCGAPRSAPPA